MNTPLRISVHMYVYVVGRWRTGKVHMSDLPEGV